MYNAAKLIKLLNLACSKNIHEAATAATMAWMFIKENAIQRHEVNALRKALYRPEIIEWLYKTMRYESKATGDDSTSKEKAHSGGRYESKATDNDPASRFKAKANRKKEPRYESSDTYPTHCEMCGTRLDDVWAWGSSERNKGTNFGRPRHFCSDACKQKNYRQRQKEKRRAS